MGAYKDAYSVAGPPDKVIREVDPEAKFVYVPGLPAQARDDHHGHREAAGGPVMDAEASWAAGLKAAFGERRRVDVPLARSGSTSPSRRSDLLEVFDSLRRAAPRLPAGDLAPPSTCGTGSASSTTSW